MNDNELVEDITDYLSTITAMPVNAITGNMMIDTNNTVSIVNSNGNISEIKAAGEDMIDEHAMCKFTVDHKVTAQELLKLKEVAPDYAKEIKENIAKNLARDISHKISYTKKHDKDTDVHHFIGRVWVFTEDELRHLLGIK